MSLVWTRAPLEEAGKDESVFVGVRSDPIDILLSAGLEYPIPPPPIPDEIIIEVGIVDITSFPFPITTTETTINITADILETGAIFNQGYIEYVLPNDLSTIIRTTTNISNFPDNVIIVEYYSDRRALVSFPFEIYADVLDNDTSQITRNFASYSIELTNNWTIDAQALGFLMLNKDASQIAPELL